MCLVLDFRCLPTQDVLWLSCRKTIALEFFLLKRQSQVATTPGMRGGKAVGTVEDLERLLVPLDA